MSVLSPPDTSGQRLLPGLLPRRFTAEEQAADRTAARTRVLKDVLRVGRWRVGPDGSDDWVVTRPLLASLVRQFEIARKNGVIPNLTWGHGHPESGVVDPRDLIAPIDQLLLVDDTLWATAYVTPGTSAQLRNPACRASVRVVENWTDGRGQTYPLLLLHVAVVDQPVVPAQGPFRDLSLLKGKRTMEIDFERTVSTVNELLQMWGESLPHDVSPETFHAALEETVERIRAANESEADAETQVDESASALIDASIAARPRGSTDVHRLMRHVRTLSKQVAELQRDHSRGRYLSQLRDLAAQGQVSARVRQQLENAGARIGYDLSLLEPFRQAGQISFGQTPRRRATSSPPSLSGLPSDLTEDEITAAAVALGGKAPA